MNFIPYPGKIHFLPIKQESIIASDKDTLVEAGKVISVGEGVTFVKPGDTVFFLVYGAEETPEMDGEKFWTVADDPRFMMGKLENE